MSAAICTPARNPLIGPSGRYWSGRVEGLCRADELAPGARKPWAELDVPSAVTASPGRSLARRRCSRRIRIRANADIDAAIHQYLPRGTYQRIRAGSAYGPLTWRRSVLGDDHEKALRITNVSRRKFIVGHGSRRAAGWRSDSKLPFIGSGRGRNSPGTESMPGSSSNPTALA